MTSKLTEQPEVPADIAARAAELGAVVQVEGEESEDRPYMLRVAVTGAYIWPLPLSLAEIERALACLRHEQAGDKDAWAKFRLTRV